MDVSGGGERVRDKSFDGEVAVVVRTPQWLLLITSSRGLELYSPKKVVFRKKLGLSGERVLEQLDVAEHGSCNNIRTPSHASLFVCACVCWMKNEMMQKRNASEERPTRRGCAELRHSERNAAARALDRQRGGRVFSVQNESQELLGLEVGVG